ncbi:MAG: aspartate aminotransferase family protein [Conexivisphaerales archaeon]
MDEQEVKRLEDSMQLHTYHKLPIVLERGEGVYLFDKSGKRYIDFMSAYGVAILGHSNVAVIEAVQNQMQKLISCHGSVYNEARAKLLSKLKLISPPDLQHFYLCNSGAEAIEAAMKFARKVRRKKGFIAFSGGYHGKTFGALSVTWGEKYREPFAPLLDGVVFGRYGDVEQLEKLPFEEVAAVIVEPVQGESGIKMANQEFFNTIQSRCKETGCLMIVDEIQTGLGRTGKMWGHEHYALRPDIITVAKGIGGGIPLGVTMVSNKVAEAIELGDHTTTFGGNPVAAAAGCAVIDFILSNRLIEHSRSLGKVFRERLAEMSNQKLYKESRNMGLMAALELRIKFMNVLDEALKHGLITLYSGLNIIRMLPPLIISKEQLDEGLDILLQALKKTGENL